MDHLAFSWDAREWMRYNISECTKFTNCFLSVGYDFTCLSLHIINRAPSPNYLKMQMSDLMSTITSNEYFKVSEYRMDSTWFSASKLLLNLINRIYTIIHFLILVQLNLIHIIKTVSLCVKYNASFVNLGGNSWK